MTDTPHPFDTEAGRNAQLQRDLAEAIVQRLDERGLLRKRDDRQRIMFAVLSACQEARPFAMCGDGEVLAERSLQLIEKLCVFGQAAIETIDGNVHEAGPERAREWLARKAERELLDDQVPF